MRIDLDLPATPGENRAMKQAPFFAEIARPLNADEIDMPAAPSEAQTLKRISDRHRRMARMLASGMTPTQVCVATGVLPPRLSVLQNDPSFSALVAFYREQVDEAFVETTEKLAELSGEAVAELMERLETQPEQLDVKELLDIAKLGLDRTGHGPQSSTQNTVNVNIGARLDSAYARMKTINAKAEEQ